MMEERPAATWDRGGRGSEGRVENLDIGTAAASKLLLGFGVEVWGWSIAESAGAVAKVRLRDGRDATGAVLAVIPLAANGTSQIGPSDGSVTCDTGLFLEVVSGSVEGAIYWSAPQAPRRE